jgi:hypothetical protein
MRELKYSNAFINKFKFGLVGSPVCIAISNGPEMNVVNSSLIPENISMKEPTLSEIRTP